jgi:hypothetical protein
VLEHLLTHGPESVAEEFQSGKDVINQLKGFQYIDQQGYVWLLFFSFQFWLKLGHCFSSSQHALLDVKLVCENLDYILGRVMTFLYSNLYNPLFVNILVLFCSGFKFLRNNLY